MDPSDAADAVRVLYPQVWHALHLTHPTDRSAVSPRDMAVLTHLASTPGAAPSAIAQHLGVAESTLSEAVTDLAARGLVSRSRSETDRRRVTVELTGAGRDAIAAGSGLDPERVGAALATLSPAERDAVVRGLELLVRGCAARYAVPTSAGAR